MGACARSDCSMGCCLLPTINRHPPPPKPAHAKIVGSVRFPVLKLQTFHPPYPPYPPRHTEIKNLKLAHVKIAGSVRFPDGLVACTLRLAGVVITATVPQPHHCHSHGVRPATAPHRKATFAARNTAPPHSSNCTPRNRFSQRVALRGIDISTADTGNTEDTLISLRFFVLSDRSGLRTTEDNSFQRSALTFRRSSSWCLVTEIARICSAAKAPPATAYRRPGDT